MTSCSLVLAFAALASIAAPAGVRAQDFVPGDRVLYFENFGAPRDTVMKRLRNVSPRVSFQARAGQPGLHARTPSSFDVVLPERLPERYTIEFDFFIPGENHVALTLLEGTDEGNGTVVCGPHTVTFASGEGDDRTTQVDGIEGLGGNTEERVNHCAVAVDGDRVGVWINGIRVAEESGLALGRSDRLRVHFAGVEDPTLLDQNIPVWLTNLRIAAIGAR